MTAKPNGLNRDATEYFLEILSGLGPGDEGFVDLEAAAMDRRTAEQHLRSAADELGLEIELVPSALVFRIADEEFELPPPSAAWLLLGDESSVLERSDLDEINSDEEDDGAAMWTGLPNIAPGDVLFFYFLAPREAVHFVARAVDRPVWEGDDAEGRAVDVPQWWVPFSAIVEVEPIGITELRAAFGGDLDVGGQLGVRVPAAAANQLLDHVRVSYASDPWCAERAVERVYGLDALPASSDVTLDDLREISSADLGGEEEVGTYIVEPLLRLCGVEPPDYEVRRSYVHGRDAADYAVLVDGVVRAIVEVEHRIRLDAGGQWFDSPDVEEAAGRAEAFDAPFLVVDCDQILLFDPGEHEPYLVMDRFDLDDEDLEFIRDHLADDEV